MLVGVAAHAAAPDSGQGASMALKDVQMLTILLCPYDADLPKVAKACKDMRIPCVGKILRWGRQGRWYGDSKHDISWFRAAVRDLILWIMCHLLLCIMLWLNPTHLYDVEAEVAKYLVAMT
ncbi:hypothetical protein EDD18DRAFT_1344676 [Armillaria luteobubalina]|uniref:Uncharacterized protein n=1 Tax=Armillaria luteobubalina TaxID=153913 RepID=A0AA39QK41_9AGAR|nr:hypothetical protein EDD18DRAFT_1344676 [Armillaria luteobubalina]